MSDEAPNTVIAFAPAVRKATPVVVSLAGRTGSGKTLSALLLARGLVGAQGKIGVICTENKRSLIYADDKDVGGFAVSHLYPPYHPHTFIAAIDAADRAGLDALVIDSATHEWSGIGGCIEWAESLDPTGRLGPLAWGKVKAGHRRFVNRLLQAKCHVILCLRADHKLVAYKDDKGKQQFAESEELIPEQEKKFVYEMTVSAVIDNDHRARFVKLPKPLVGKLMDGQMISASTGEAIRSWVNGGEAIDPEVERQLSIARDIASSGLDNLNRHWEASPKNVRAILRSHWGDLKSAAIAADEMLPEEESEPRPGSEEVEL